MTSEQDIKDMEELFSKLDKSPPPPKTDYTQFINPIIPDIEHFSVKRKAELREWWDKHILGKIRPMSPKQLQEYRRTNAEKLKKIMAS